MKNVGHSTILKLCRLCGESNSNCINIFSTQGEKLLIAIKLEKLHIKIYRHEHLPESICYSCLFKLQLSCDFIENCVITQIVWNNIHYAANKQVSQINLSDERRFSVIKREIQDGIEFSSQRENDDCRDGDIRESTEEDYHSRINNGIEFNLAKKLSNEDCSNNLSKKDATLSCSILGEELEKDNSDFDCVIGDLNEEDPYAPIGSELITKNLCKLIKKENIDDEEEKESVSSENISFDLELSCHESEPEIDKSEGEETICGTENNDHSERESRTEDAAIIIKDGKKAEEGKRKVKVKKKVNIMQKVNCKVPVEELKENEELREGRYEKETVISNANEGEMNGKELKETEKLEERRLNKETEISNSNEEEINGICKILDKTSESCENQEEEVKNGFENNNVSPMEEDESSLNPRSDEEARIEETSRKGFETISNAKEITSKKKGFLKKNDYLLEEAYISAYYDSGEKIFKCNLCDKSYNTINKCALHVQDHTGRRPFVCNFCNYKAKNQLTLNRHILGIHAHLNRNVCQYCQKSFLNMEKYHQHLNCHITSGNECKDCEMSFPDYFSYYSHNKTFHKPKDDQECHDIFICDICRKEFKSKLEIFVHIHTHHSSQPDSNFHKCDICSNLFKSKDQLNEHLKTHQQNMKRSKLKGECLYCEKTFANKQRFQWHVLKVHKETKCTGNAPNSKQYSCQYCEKCFQNPTTYHQHLNCHITSGNECKTCKMSFPDYFSLYIHNTAFHEIKPRVRGGGCFQCSQCSKIFGRIDHLKVHILGVHNKIKTKCKICSKVVGVISLMEHMKIHNTADVFTCDVCKKEFRTKINIYNHIRKHHISEPIAKSHMCHICSKLFANKTLLEFHLQTHGNAKNFVCHICSKAFKRKSYLALHMFSHGKKKFICPKCGKGFNRQDNMKKHYSSYCLKKS